MCMGGNFTKDLEASSHKAETGTSTLAGKAVSVNRGKIWLKEKCVNAYTNGYEIICMKEDKYFG